MKNWRAWLLGSLVAGTLLLVAASLVLADGALHIPIRPKADEYLAQRTASASSAQWRAVQTTAADGTILRAWIFTPRVPNGSAVILLHGVGDTRAGMLGHAGYLMAAGFTVLTPDSRGHGVSGGDSVTYGVKEAGDVHRWSEWLLDYRPGTRLYGMGESMGAGILLQSLATEPRWRALVAECPFATFQDIAYERLSRDSGSIRLAFWPVIQIGFTFARARYGVDLRQASPVDAIRASKVPILLIHGTADSNIPYRNSEVLHAANPESSELWLVPGAHHVRALERNPDLYIRRVTAWFREH